MQEAFNYRKFTGKQGCLTSERPLLTTFGNLSVFVCSREVGGAVESWSQWDMRVLWSHQADREETLPGVRIRMAKFPWGNSTWCPSLLLSAWCHPFCCLLPSPSSQRCPMRIASWRARLTRLALADTEHEGWWSRWRRRMLSRDCSQEGAWKWSRPD